MFRVDGELNIFLTTETAKNPIMNYRNESFTGNRFDIFSMPSTVIQFHCYNHHTKKRLVTAQPEGIRVVVVFLFPKKKRNVLPKKLSSNIND